MIHGKQLAFIILWTLILPAFISCSNPGIENQPDYKNPGLSPEARAEDLLHRMTLEEKVAQTLCVWQKKDSSLITNGQFDEQKAILYFGDRGFGQVGRPSDIGGKTNAREMAELTNAIQKFFVEKSRLGIPVFFHEECLHGHYAFDATMLPQPIALASSFDPELIQEIYTMVAEEVRVKGGHLVLAPNLDVSRDPRWGRIQETFGEDPYLTGEMGKSIVKALQGDATFYNRKNVIATLKHFTGHGQPEGGINCAPMATSERTLMEVFDYPFKEAIQKSGALSVMASYNEVDGIPVHASKRLLRNKLKEEWGFKGIVVSDYHAVAELYNWPNTQGHYVANDFKNAAELAMNAGVDIELPENNCYPNLVELVKEGKVKESVLDEAVIRVLTLKFRFGLFDDPYVDPAHAEAIVATEKNGALARKAAQNSITMLKNQDNLAPFDKKKIKTIAVIGPNANRVLLGDYSRLPNYYYTVLDGIKEKFGDTVEVLYSEGCRMVENPGNWKTDPTAVINIEEDLPEVRKAVQLARKADLVILALGGDETIAREAWARFHLGDRSDLSLPGAQNRLVEEISKTKKSVVAFVFGAQPMALENLNELVPVIFQCWFLGQETGRAIADVLFGDFNPCGKLAISMPRSAGHSPVFYNHKPTARRGYLFSSVSPLFPFGYGLSYSEFSISKPRLEPNPLGIKDSATVQVEVTNLSRRFGKEVVQLYIRDMVSSVTRPVKELKDFKSVGLEPGETKTVKFIITPEKLAFYGIDMNKILEPGDFQILIGNSSEKLDTLTLTVTQ